MAKPKNTKVKKASKVVGKHSSPETSGKQNLPKEYIARNKDKVGGDGMKNIKGVYDHGKVNSKEYKGLWTDEALEKEIGDYFTYCVETQLKPAKVGLRLWLGLSKSQYWEWENGVDKYGYKSNLINDANSFMEMQYVDRIESFPTGNIFLLKSSHGHVDKQEVTVNSNIGTSDAEINDAISKLGLDK